MSESLRLLRGNERPWANRSGRSEEMSDRERIAQVAQRKWATVSKSLRSLKTNEQPWAIHSGRSEEMSEWAICSKKILQKKSKTLLFVGFIYDLKLLKNERIAHFRSFSLFWWAMWVNRSFRSNEMSDVSESLRSLTKNERPWANRSGCSPKISEWANRTFALFSQKTSDLLRKPMSEFPALLQRL